MLEEDPCARLPRETHARIQGASSLTSRAKRTIRTRTIQGIPTGRSLNRAGAASTILRAEGRGTFSRRRVNGHDIAAADRIDRHHSDPARRQCTCGRALSARRRRALPTRGGKLPFSVRFRGWIEPLGTVGPGRNRKRPLTDPPCGHSGHRNLPVPSPLWDARLPASASLCRRSSRKRMSASPILPSRCATAAAYSSESRSRRM